MEQKQQIEVKRESEKIPLLSIYKQDGLIKARATDDTMLYELYGFLECYMESLRNDLVFCIGKYKEDNV